MADQTHTHNPDLDPETSVPPPAATSPLQDSSPPAQMKRFPQEQQQLELDSAILSVITDPSNALNYPGGYESSEGSDGGEPADFSIDSMGIDQPPPIPRHSNTLVRSYLLCTPVCRKRLLLVLIVALFGGAMLGVGYAIGNNVTTTQSISSSQGEEVMEGEVDVEALPIDGRVGSDDYMYIYDQDNPLPPPSRYSIIRDIITPISGTAALDDPLSPQSEALTWVVYHDAMAVDPAQDLYTLIQRYTLATFYFSTEGARWFTKHGWIGGSDMCQWHGVTCEESDTGEFYVTKILISKNNVAGKIPSEFGELIKLKEIELWENDIEGTIPEEIGQLKELTRLYLDDNKLAGQIPPSIGNLVELQQLALFGNDLDGPIPTEIGKLKNLKRLWINDMGLSGTIPTEIGGMTSLAFLYLEGNKLVGSIPDQIGSLSLLEDVRLERNALRGSLPVGMRHLINLTDLYLNENDLLIGSLPEWIGDLTKLEYLYLDNNMFGGRIPATLSNLVNLRVLTLEGNNFSGTVPNGVCTLPSPSLISADCAGDDPEVQCSCCVCK